MSSPNPHPQTLSRRKALARLSIGLTTLAAAIAGIPMLAYLLGPLIAPPANIWRTLGPVTKFQPGQTVQASYEDPSPLAWAGLTAMAAVWVRRNSTSTTDFTIFAVNCTHLGCPVTWVPDGQIFLCPCHGGVFNANGTVAGGPPPRPLFQYQSRVVNGDLQILTEPLPVG